MSKPLNNKLVYSEQRSIPPRAWTPAPPELDKALQLLRLLPLTYWLPDESTFDLQVLYDHWVEHADSGVGSGDEEQLWVGASEKVLEAVNTIREFLNELPDGFRSYLASKVRREIEVPDLIQMIETCHRFRELMFRIDLIWVIGHQRKSRPRKGVASFAVFPKVDGKIIVNSDGRFEVDVDPLFTQLQGVEAKRIRKCPRCKYVFWAGRLSMQACSTECAKVLRTRKWREKTTLEQRNSYKWARVKKASKPRQSHS